MMREGSVGILQYGEKFDVTFARYDWSGVMSPRRLYGHEALIDFLQNKLRFTADVMKDAMRQLESQGSACLPNVHLIDEERLSLGLVATSEGISNGWDAQSAG